MREALPSEGSDYLDRGERYAVKHLYTIRYTNIEVCSLAGHLARSWYADCPVLNVTLPFKTGGQICSLSILIVGGCGPFSASWRSEPRSTSARTSSAHEPGCSH